MPGKKKTPKGYEEVDGMIIKKGAGKFSQRSKDKLDDSDLEAKSHKVRITTYIDGDLLEECKKLSGGKGYQTILNSYLRKGLFGASDPIDLRLKIIESRLDKIENRKKA